MLRFYNVKVGEDISVRAEWWTKDTVTIFIEDKSGSFILDQSEPQNPAAHYILNSKPYGWGQVPFIEFPNNSFRSSDLEVTKTLIDEYDRAFSDFANINAEVLELILILRGYESTDLATFKQNLNHYKTLKLRGDSNSGVDKLDMTIPVEAKRELLDRLEENIFMFGQGVNVKTDRFGNSPSGASLEFLYTSLDLKASMMERKFRKSVRTLLWFTTAYINMTKGTSFDSNTILVQFRKNMVQNNKEIIESLKISKDMISDETIVSLYPLIEDTSYEFNKLLIQRLNNLKTVADIDKLIADLDGMSAYTDELALGSSNQQRGSPQVNNE